MVKTKKKGPDRTPDARKLYFLEQADYLISELGRVGVTRLLPWQEYLKECPEGFGYSRFCELLDIQINLKSPTMVFEHNPGELLEIDFAGSRLSYVATSTGEIIACPVLIGVLPFSGLGYAKALPDASLARIIPALNDILNYFGGAPLNAKSDNMKQWVVRSCRYETTFPQALEQWAMHNHIGLLATRVRSPKDKPSVGNQVKIIYRRVYAAIRNETFHSIQELDQGIRKALEAHHDINFQKKSFSRRELFTIAFREAIINAFVHNDYTREIAPKFEIFKDRIEITSAGSLPEGLSKSEFFDGFSIPRNKELMRIFKDLDLVEQLGSGIPRIL